jgi:predicted metal-dependent hydrolase
MCASSQQKHLSNRPPDAFLRGIEEFNARRFFEAHEVWEELWLSSAEPDKTFLQGIIQIAAAFHHHLRGNQRGACSLFRAGLRRVTPFPDDHFGIDLGSLRSQSIACLTALTSGVPDALPIPRIMPVTRG